MNAATIPRRVAPLAAILVFLIGLGAAVASAAPTRSAWTDASFSSVAVTAGEWAAPVSYGCVAMNANGGVKEGGTCKVTGVVFDQWGDDSQHHRNYYVSVDSNAGSGFVRLTLDLSAATMRLDLGTGTWKWGNAATTGGELGPSSACSALPTLVADSPVMWSSSRSFYLQATDNKSAAWSGSVTCK